MNYINKMQKRGVILVVLSIFLLIYAVFSSAQNGGTGCCTNPDYPIGTVEDCKSHAIRRIMNHYKISIDRTLMIGDTEFDMQGAKEAGVISVAAMYGSSKPEELSKMQPDFSISSPTQIYDVIDEIVNEDYSPTHI